jgi:uncharacterized protein (DUF302 family)
MTGLIVKPSPYSVRETIDRLEILLRTKGIKVFARIDQAAEAKTAGLEMPPMELLLFGNPKAGTPLMLAVPEAGIDLPLKAMAWQDGDGRVHLGYNDPAYLQSRFNLPAELLGPFSAVAALIESVL